MLPAMFLLKVVGTICKSFWVGFKKPDENAEPVVKIHYSENGFYANPEDIFSHPNVPKQLKLLDEWIERQEQEDLAASKGNGTNPG